MRLPDPGRLLGADTSAAAEDQQLDAVYFDTADLRLARAGITLRRREGGSDAGWHLKLPVGADSRDELRVPLGRARRTPPAELTALTRVHTRGREAGSRWSGCAPGGGAGCSPTATAGRWPSWSRTGSPRTPWAPAPRPPRGGRSRSSWPSTATPTLLDRIEKRLLEAGARRSGSASKLSRVLADRLRRGRDQPAPAPRARPARPCWPTCATRPTRCAATTRWCARTPRTPCTRCGWRAGGCAARCRPTGGCWTATPPAR